MPQVGLAALVLGFALVACQRESSLDNPSAVNMAPANAAVAAPPVAVAPVAPVAPAAAPVEGRVVPSDAKRADFERRVEEARRAVDVTVYGASWCPSCKQTRAWLDSKGMAYSERDIDSSDDAKRSANRLNPAGTIPVIDVEGEVIVGFAPEMIDRTIRRRAERKVQN